MLSLSTLGDGLEKGQDMFSTGFLHFARHIRKINGGRRKSSWTLDWIALQISLESSLLEKLNMQKQLLNQILSMVHLLA